MVGRRKMGEMQCTKTGEVNTRSCAPVLHISVKRLV